MLWSMILGLLGIGLFLFGMTVLRLGLNGLLGSLFQNMLVRATHTPASACLTGVVVTAGLQSSSAVTALTVGLVHNGLITFPQSLGLILGSNLGTCITAQLISLQLAALIPIALVPGLALIFYGRGKQHYAGLALAGLGAILAAVTLMMLAAGPLSSQFQFTSWFSGLAQQPWKGVIAGTIATAVIQSSSATTAIVMSLAAQGSIPLTGSIALILGSNIGSCTTALFAAIGSNRDGQRVALAHLVYNAGGAVIMMLLLQPFASLIAFTAIDPARQVANAHTLFNLLSLVAALPYVNLLARIITYLLP